MKIKCHIKICVKNKKLIENRKMEYVHKKLYKLATLLIMYFIYCKINKNKT